MNEVPSEYKKKKCCIIRTVQKSVIIGRFCCTLELIELRMRPLIRCARFLIRNIDTENTYECCFIRRPIRMRQPPIPLNPLVSCQKKKVQLSGDLEKESLWSLIWTFRL